MQNEDKRIFSAGKMNKDLDPRFIPSGEYIDALNVSVGHSEGSNVGAVENLRGNKLLPGQESITGKVIGYTKDESNGKIYYFVEDNGKDALYEFDQETEEVNIVLIDSVSAPQVVVDPDTGMEVTASLFVSGVISGINGAVVPRNVTFGGDDIGTNISNVNGGMALSIELDNLEGTWNDISQISRVCFFRSDDGGITFNRDVTSFYSITETVSNGIATLFLDGPLPEEVEDTHFELIIEANNPANSFSARYRRSATNDLLRSFESAGVFVDTGGDHDLHLTSNGGYELAFANEHQATRPLITGISPDGSETASEETIHLISMDILDRNIHADTSGTIYAYPVGAARVPNDPAANSVASYTFRYMQAGDPGVITLDVNITGIAVTGNPQTANVTGGEAPFTFRWTRFGSPDVVATTQTFTPTEEGLYNVVVTDSETPPATDADSVRVELPSLRTINYQLDTTTLTAPPDSYTLTEPGGASISIPVDRLNTSLYSVQFRDGEMYSIEDPTITLLPGFRYSENPRFGGLSPNGIVRGADVQVIRSLTGTIEAIPTTLSVNVPGVSVQTGNSVTLTATVTGGVPPYSYQWLDQSNNPIAGATNSTLVLPSMAAGALETRTAVVTDSDSPTPATDMDSGVARWVAVPVNAPGVSTEPATNVAHASAVFHGRITAENGETPTSAGFRYGTDPALGSFNTVGTPESPIRDGFQSGVVLGLIPLTTYYFRAVATNSAGTSLGTILSFTTLETPLQPADILEEISVSPNGDTTVITNGRGSVYYIGTTNPGAGNTPTTAGLVIQGNSYTLQDLYDAVDTRTGRIPLIGVEVTDPTATNVGARLSIRSISTATQLPGIPNLTILSPANVQSTGTDLRGAVNSIGANPETLLFRYVVNTSQSPPTQSFLLSSGIAVTISDLTTGNKTSRVSYASDFDNTRYIHVLMVGTTTLGTAVSAIVTGTIAPAQIPNNGITTVAAFEITQEQANTRLTLTDGGSGIIGDTGVIWGTSLADVNASKGTRGVLRAGVSQRERTPGSFGDHSILIFPLVANTTYYWAPYTTNPIGRTYGATSNFTTTSVPTLPAWNASRWTGSINSINAQGVVSVTNGNSAPTITSSHSPNTGCDATSATVAYTVPNPDTSTYSGVSFSNRTGLSQPSTGLLRFTQATADSVVSVGSLSVNADGSTSGSPAVSAAGTIVSFEFIGTPYAENAGNNTIPRTVNVVVRGSSTSCNPTEEFTTSITVNQSTLRRSFTVGLLPANNGTFDASARSGSISITTGPTAGTFTFTPGLSDPAFTLTMTSTGVNFSVPANTTTSSRTATFTVAHSDDSNLNQTITLTQLGVIPLACTNQSMSVGRIMTMPGMSINDTGCRVELRSTSGFFIFGSFSAIVFTSGTFVTIVSSITYNSSDSDGSACTSSTSITVDPVECSPRHNDGFTWSRSDGTTGIGSCNNLNCEGAEQ